MSKHIYFYYKVTLVPNVLPDKLLVILYTNLPHLSYFITISSNCQYVFNICNIFVVFYLHFFYFFISILIFASFSNFIDNSSGYFPLKTILFIPELIIILEHITQGCVVTYIVLLLIEIPY